MDSVQANASFAQRHQFRFPLLSDVTGEVCQGYGACSDLSDRNVRRITFVIDPDGVIRHIHDDPHPEGHIETVLAYLKSSTDSGLKESRHVINPILHSGTDEGKKSTVKGYITSMDEQRNNLESNLSADNVKATTNQLWQSQVNPANDQNTKTTVLDLPAISNISQQYSEVKPIGTLGQVQAAQASDKPQLVFALGLLGISFKSETRRDSIAQHMVDSNNPNPNPHDLAQFLNFLDKDGNANQAESVFWTLNVGTPIYAVMPIGAFASDGYARLRQFAREQLTEGVERVSIAGVICGQVSLMSGQVIPVICPESRCMYSWTTSALVESVVGKYPPESATKQEQETYVQKTMAVTNFLRRIYDELRNLGITAQERAMNYAATNIANALTIFEAALAKNLELHSIELEPSPICRPGADCWDVKLLFFDPENVLRAKFVYRLTVDVSDVCPVPIGEIRSWSMP